MLNKYIVKEHPHFYHQSSPFHPLHVLNALSQLLGQ